MTTTTSTRILKAHTCGKCGVVFAMDEVFIADRKKDRRVWYCPNGHPRVFTGPTEESKLRQQLEDTERSLRWAREERDGARQLAESEKRRHAATKGQLTKTKKRVANGVCPCCNRSFPNLADHMKGQHPDYVERAS